MILKQMALFVPWRVHRWRHQKGPGASEDIFIKLHNQQADFATVNRWSYDILK